jgi:hypothetical protein
VAAFLDGHILFRYSSDGNATTDYKLHPPVPPNDPATTLAYSIKARRGGYVVTPDLIVPFDRHNPMNWGQLETQMALGSAADGEASCAQRTFPAFVDGFFQVLVLISFVLGAVTGA